MSYIVPAYTFSHAAKTVTFTGLGTVPLEDVLLITDVTNNTTIYQFNNAALGGAISGNVLTLTFNTNVAGFADSDHLQILFASPLPSGSTSDNTTLDSGTFSAPATGNVYSTTGYSVVSFQFSGNWCGAIIVQQSNDQVEWFPVLLQDAATGLTTDTIEVSGIFTAQVSAGFMQYVATVVDCTVAFTVMGKVTPGPSSTNLLAQALDQSTGVAMSANITNLKTDANNALMLSDGLTIQLTGVLNQNIIIDTLGYQCLQVTSQSLVATIQISNDRVTWNSFSGGWVLNSNTLFGSVSAGTSNIIPCVARFIRLIVTTAGTATAVLRNQPGVSYTNLVVGGSALASGGANGSAAVGGLNAAGVAPTANPIGISGIDSSGIGRRLQTDFNGRPVVTGQLPIAFTNQQVSAIPTIDFTQTDTFSPPELLLAILTELKIVSLYLFQIAGGGVDEPSDLRAIPSDLE